MRHVLEELSLETKTELVMAIISEFCSKCADNCSDIYDKYEGILSQNSIIDGPDKKEIINEIIKTIQKNTS